MRKPHPDEFIADALGGPLALELAPNCIAREPEPKPETDTLICDECFHHTGDVVCKLCRATGRPCRTHANYQFLAAAMIVGRERKASKERKGYTSRNRPEYEMPKLPRKRRQERKGE